MEKLLNMKNTFCFFFLIALMLNSSIFSQNQVRFISENDGYGSFSDHYYTNGGRLEFHTMATEANLTRYLLSGYNDIFVSSNDETKYWMGLSMGQEFYTPTNIKKADISYGDRPYSSRAYFGNSLTSWTDNSSVTTELEFGMIGPNVGGKTAQKKFHNYIGSPIPEGWDSQIPNAGTFGVRTDVRTFYHPFFGTHYNVNLGTANTDASLGFIFRLGNVGRQPGPGFSALQPGPPILKDENNGFWYFYVNPGATFQAYNATIEGNIGDKRRFSSTQSGNLFSSNSSLYQLDNDPNTLLGNIVLENLSKDNGNNTLERYALFNLFLVQGSNNPNDFTINYLLFNNIFNSAEQIEAGLRIYLIQNLLEEWNTLGDQQKIIALYSLFRPEATKLNPVAKYLSYELLSTYILDPNQRVLFLELLRQNFAETEGKTYVAGVKRAVGFIRAGFVLVTDGGTLFSLNYNYSTIDFQSAKGLPQGHQWLGFQLGKVF
jgi:hypothetical protein